MIIDGRWYVDGGVVDNFPVRLLKGRCDVIIGSHVSPLPQVKAADFDSALDVAQRVDVRAPALAQGIRLALRDGDSV